MASEDEDWIRVQDTIHNGPDGPAKDLLRACWYGDKARVEAVLNRDSSLVNYAEPSSGLTPLHLAAKRNKRAVVRVLLRCEQLRDVQLDFQCRSPLDLAPRPAGDIPDPKSCFHLLAKGVEQRAWRAKEEEKQQRQRAPADRADVRPVLRYLFPAATTLHAGVDFLCLFEYGAAFPATLILDGETVAYCCDKPKGTFSIKDNLDSEARVLEVECTRVGRVGRSSQGVSGGEDGRREDAEPTLLCVILMKASAEWLQKTARPAEEFNSDQLRAFLEDTLDGSGKR